MKLWLVTYAYYSETASVGLVRAATGKEAIARVLELDGVPASIVDTPVAIPVDVELDVPEQGFVRHVDAPH